ncbi:hypothetical protein M9Y10_006704 [Tritrichomonas musculus]|uniref:Uncharacterized protein n=1 Tax=Tritrichomonas musculus TaxID=1915356 RepID=A0ABR2JH27_9EUKA
MDHLLLFLSEFFDIGNSSGSLLSEALGLFKTFQKIGATKTFSVHFSNECYKMFSWATNIIELIKYAFYFRPLSDYEIYYIYNFAIPMAIVTYLTASASYVFIYYLYMLYGLLLMLGIGLGYIQMDTKKVIFLLVAVFVIIVVVLFLGCCCCGGDFLDFVSHVFESVTDVNPEDVADAIFLKFSFALAQSLLVITLLLTPILIKSSKLTKIYSIALIVVIILSIIIEITINCLVDCGNLDMENEYKYISFGLTCFSLIIVPATKYFMIVNNEVYKNNWRCIFGYIFFSLLLPVALTVMMIIAKVPSMVRKYKNRWYAFIEVVDIVRQVVYAIVAALDIPWACIGLEIGWLILMFAVRPYKYFSDYVLQCGNSLIIIVETSVCIAADRNGTGFLTFSVSLALVIIACIPAVLSLFIFFLLDFGYSPSDKSDEELVYMMAMVVKYASPFAWIIYGFGVPLIEKTTKSEIL